MTDAGLAATTAALLDAARAELGCDVAMAGPPEVSARDGRYAYTCRLTGGPGPTGGAAGAVSGASGASASAEGRAALPAPWDGPLVVRVLPRGRAGAAAVAREVAWHDFGAAHGFGVPAVLAARPHTGLPERCDLPEPPPPHVVVARGPERSLVECMGEGFTARPRLVGLMGELHARLHELPVDAAPEPDDGGPLDEMARQLVASGMRGGHFAAELDRLRVGERGRRPGAQVVCHGGYQPAVVRLDPDHADSAVVANWSGARLAEREYDVAATILLLWSVPYMAAGRGQRRTLTGMRDTLIERYRAGYARCAPLDEERLRFWGAFHALAWAARMAAADGAPADPWEPTRLVSFRDSYRMDLTRRFTRLARG